MRPVVDSVALLETVRFEKEGVDVASDFEIDADDPSCVNVFDDD